VGKKAERTILCVCIVGGREPQALQRSWGTVRIEEEISRMDQHIGVGGKKGEMAEGGSFLENVGEITIDGV